MVWFLSDSAERLGMVLEFLSFWFAAPEILGEERLKQAEATLEEWMRKAPDAVYGLLVSLGTGAFPALIFIVYVRSVYASADFYESLTFGTRNEAIVVWWLMFIATFVLVPIAVLLIYASLFLAVVLAALPAVLVE